MATFKFQNKYVCGAYLNMAQNNFRITILDVLSRIGIKRKDDARDIPKLLETIYGFLTKKTKGFSDDQMNQSRTLTLRNDQQVKFKQLLFRHFPILKPILASITHRSLQPQKERLAELLSLEKDLDKRIGQLIKSLKGKDKSEQQLLNQEIKKLKTRKSNIKDEYDEELFSITRDTDLQESLNILVKMAWVLYDLRDFYTHFSPYNTPESLKEQYDRQTQVARWMSDVFAASRTIDKERNSITTEEMNFLNEAKKQGDDKKWREDPDYYFAIKGQNLLSMSFIDPDSSVYQSYLDSLYQKHRERRLASLREEMDEALERHDEEEYGFLMMLAERKDSPEKIAEIKEKIRPLALSDFGVLYFCSTFLPRNYTLLMTDHAELMENSPYSMTAEELEEKKNACRTEEERAKIVPTDTPRNNILREMMCIYRIRLPKGKRLDKKDTKGLLALDILNELRKCPEELYELFSKEGKESFIDRVNSSVEGAPDIVKRLRFGDRFAYLALRAIDECEVFNGIRFQVRLGSYRFKFYDKNCIDGSSQLRRLQKEINGFGRLQDIEALRKQLWKDLFQKREYDSVQLEDRSANLDLMQFVEDTPNSTPYITDTRAQYNIHNNRIGLIWNGNECRLLRDIRDNDIQRQKVFLPTLVNADGSPKASGKDIELPSPLCTLSIYELPALLFYHYLYNTPEAQRCEVEFDKPQQVITNRYNALRAFLNEVIQNPQQIIQDGLLTALGRHGLKQSEIPKRIRDLITACQKESKASNDAGSYLPNLLHLTMEEIRQQVRQKGMERYKDLPPKFLKKIPQEDIIRSGLDSILKPYSLSADTLPAKVVDMMLNPDRKGEQSQATEENATDTFNALFVRSVLSKLNERLEDVRNRRKSFMKAINRVGSKDNKFAKHGYMDVRHGKLAEYLAESLIKWQPTSHKGEDKLTGLNYDLLKSFLSSYGNGTDIDDLMEILKKANLIHKTKEQSPMPHPFLDKVVNKSPRNIEELYYMYICEEEEMLLFLYSDYQEAISAITDNDEMTSAIMASGKIEKDKLYQPFNAEKELEQPAFAHPSRKRWKLTASTSALVEAAKGYVSPLLLPDGLFVEPILKLIRTVYPDNNEIITELSKQNKKGEPECQSAAFIIDIYSRLVLKDHAQPYYCYDFAYPECSDFGRSYRLFNKLKNEIDQFKAYVPEPQDTKTIMQRLKDKERMREDTELFIVETERREKTEAEQAVRNKSIKEKWGFERIEEEMAKARKHATWTEQKKQEERAKMEGLAKFVQKNERAIRRYRIQDIVLFQMAKAMLASVFGDTTNGNQEHNFASQSQRELKLENVCKENFLGRTINYEYEYQVGEHTVTIRQEGMSLKNYGQFFRFLNDVRLDTLLLLLADVRSVTLTDITSEFAKYDQDRPIAFKKLHLLEELAINAKGAASLDNPDDDNFFFINSKGEREPLRNNFANLLKRLQNLQESENALLVAIRNAIGHNKYISDASQLTIDETLEIPQVAEKIVEQIEMLKQSISAIPEKHD